MILNTPQSFNKLRKKLMNKINNLGTFTQLKIVHLQIKQI
jgi:hypothetical protein